MDKVSMLENGVFMVRFKSVREKDQAIEAGPIFYNKKPMIMKN